MNHEEFLPDIYEAARSASRGYPVEVEDVRQEALLAFYARAEEITEADDEDRVRVVRRVVESAVRRYCRQEKAELEGYELRDEFRWTPDMVRALLGDAIEYELTHALPQGSADERVSGGSGKPSDGRGMQAGLLDVLTGFGLASDADREMLALRYWRGLDEAVLAERFGIAEDAMRQRLHRAVVRICQRVNDSRVRADAEHEGPGARRAISSGHGQAIANNHSDVPFGVVSRPRRVLRRVSAHDQPELQ